MPAVCAPVTVVTADGDARSPLRGPLRRPARLRPRLVPLDVPRPAPPADGGSWARVVRASLEATTQKCPMTTVLVYAWSEGAAATTDALAALEAQASPAAPRIAGVALVGNPARDRSRRTLPPAVPGAGMTPSPPGSLGASRREHRGDLRPGRPGLHRPRPRRAGRARAALRAPSHRDYARVPTGAGGRTVSAWLVDAARQAVDATAPLLLPGAPAPPRAGLFGPAPAPAPRPGSSVAR